MSILPPELDPTRHDDPADRGDVIWCERCADQITDANECPVAGVDPDRPRCIDCCRCDACAEEACSRQHTPGIGTWFAA